MSAVILSPAMDVAMGPLVPPDANDRVAIASHRLMLSRSHLHQAVDMASSDKPTTAPGLAKGLATSAIHQWWSQHPLRLVSEVTVNTAKTLVDPVAQRHPVALVAGAAAVGALVMWSRPWRWLLAPAVLAGVLPKLVSQVLTPAPAPRSTSMPWGRTSPTLYQSTSKEKT
jgi:hypothetical protein